MEKDTPLISVVMPCLNEEEAIGNCIEKIKDIFSKADISGEIVVADNGSTDGSVAIAEGKGARIVCQPMRGYGNAYLEGFANARGKWFIMVDADETYDFSLIKEFVKKLVNEGYDFVTGSRNLKFLNNRSMPLSHNLGNRLLTFLLNIFFNTRYTDVYCGYRGFSREAYERIKPVSPGMEFNLELAINAAQAGLKICEIPTELYPRKGKSKLRPYRDGWRSIRIILLHSKNKAFLYPGFMLLSAGMFIHFASILGFIRYSSEGSGGMAGIFATIFSVIGFNILNFGLGIKTYSWNYDFEPGNPVLHKFYRIFKLEHGLMLGAAMFGLGVLILSYILFGWKRTDLSSLPAPEWVYFSATLIILGVTTIFSSLSISTISLKSKNRR